MQDLAVQDLAFGRFMYFSKVKRCKLWLMFMPPVTIVRRIKICPSLSVRPSVSPSVRPQDLAFGRFMYFSKVKRCKLWLMFMPPVTIVRRIKICPSLSVCLSVRPSVRQSVRPSVRHTLWNRAGIINSSYSFQSIFLRLCILAVDIIKLYMWSFDGNRNNFN